MSWHLELLQHCENQDGSQGYVLLAPAIKRLIIHIEHFYVIDSQKVVKDNDKFFELELIESLPMIF